MATRSFAGSGRNDCRQARTPPATQSAAPSTQKEQYLKNKQEQAEARKQKNRLERAKKEIERLEAELEQVETEMAGEAAYDYVRLSELDTKKNALEERLLELYEEIDL